MVLSRYYLQCCNGLDALSPSMLGKGLLSMDDLIATRPK